MSIVSMLAAAASAVPATTQGADPNIGNSLIAASILIGIGSAVALATGAFRERSIDGPTRIERDRPLSALVAVTLLGGGTWFIGQLVYVGMRAKAFQHQHPHETFSTEKLSSTDFAILSVLPCAIGLLVFLIGDAIGRLPRRIGYSAEQLPRGLIMGVLAALATLPIVYGSSVLIDVFYRVAGISHPSEHELLGAMKEAPHAVRIMLIVGACVAAPVFEEMLFRGHIQTLLVRLFSPLPRSIFPVLAGDGAVAADVPAEPLAAVLEPSPNQLARPRWMAVFATSLIFAIIHPLWMSPIIFVLSLALGYAYERTGNLWTSIIVHAAFNSASTLVFLNLR